MQSVHIFKNERCYNAKSASYYFLYEDKYYARFSYLCTFKFYWKIYSQGKFAAEFFMSFFFTFPWMNKFLSTEYFLPLLIKEGIYSSPHCILQSIFALNTCSIKTNRSRVVKVLTLFRMGAK